MKHLFLLLVFVAASLTIFADTSVDKSNCTCKNIPLRGKVKVVNAFPDFKIKVVEAFPDIKVKRVSAFPDKCGEWQFVDAFPDFTVQFVDAFPDFKVQFVEAFPGVK